MESQDTIKSLKLNIKLIKLLFLVLTFNFSFYITLSLSICTNNSYSQNASIGINKTGVVPNSSALLDIDVTGMSPKAGLLIPRMTIAERDAITATIPESLLIYNKDTHCFEAYYNGVWVAFGCINCLIPPTAPTVSTSIPSDSQIIWNWNPVNGASGYQWNTSSIYPGAGINAVSSPTYTQTGLTCVTSYSLNVWTFNNCGNSSATSLTQSTSACCVANKGVSCDKGGWKLIAGCGDPNYGCAAFEGIYYNSPNGCDPNTAGSWLEYKFDGTHELVRGNNLDWSILGDSTSGYHCTYVGYAYYDPFHYPQPPNGTCFNSSKAGYGGTDTWTKLIPGTGCATNKWVSDMTGIIQCDGSCQ